MTELFMAWLGEWGPIVVFCVTFLSCLAIPIPSSIVMLTAGGFAASGDLSLAAVAAAALVGAVLGDNAGYWLARGAQSHLTRWITTSPARTGLYDRAGAYMDRWGGSSVFFSCWLVAPLGPWMNYLSGITRFRWSAFALWGLAGEIVWVSIYVGLGYALANQISTLSTLLGDISGLLVSIVAVLGLGVMLARRLRKPTAT